MRSSRPQQKAPIGAVLRHLAATRPRLVKVVVCLAQNKSRQHTETFRVSPRKDPDSERVRTELIAQAIQKAQKANSAFGNTRWMLHDYSTLL